MTTFYKAFVLIDMEELLERFRDFEEKDNMEIETFNFGSP